MSTFTDGAPPSVSPEPGDDPGSENGREPAPASEPGEWLREEMRRRMAARAAAGGGARHARRGGPTAQPGIGQTSGHRPRHATPSGPPAPRPAGAPGTEQEIPPRPILRVDGPQPEPGAPVQPVPPGAGEPPVPTFGGPAVLHPALGGHAPDQAYGASPRPGVGFGDPALLGGDGGRPVRPAPKPSGPGLTRLPVPEVFDADPTRSAPGLVLPPSVAFRDGAAAARAGGAGTADPETDAGMDPATDGVAPAARADVTGPTPVVDPVAVPDSGPLPPNRVPTGPNPVENLRRVDPPAAPAVGIGPGLPALGATSSRTGHRVVPPDGSAAARLLSPPPSPPSTPTGIPISAVAETGPLTAHVPAVAPAHPDHTVEVPTQRGPAAVVDDGTVTTDLAATSVAGPTTSPRSYVDYDDYDDDYDDPELDAEIAAAAALGTGTEQDPEALGRVRVVLATRKSSVRPVRTMEDVRTGTAVGEVLRRELIRSQLRVALAFAAVAIVVLGALPLVFAFLPEFGRASVLGIRLPWLLLGGLVYPFLWALGSWHARTAEKVEKGFADHVQGQ